MKNPTAAQIVALIADARENLQMLIRTNADMRLRASTERRIDALRVKLAAVAY